MDDPREKWNRRYREQGPPAARGPSQWLRENQVQLEQRRGGRALDLACGPGRNALHLAALGLSVEALDISDVAIEQLTAAASDADLAVDARVCDLEHERLAAARYDVVVLIDYLQRSLFESVPWALAPGGVVIAETVTRAHIEQLGRSFDPRFVLEPGELARAFPGLTVLRSQEAVVQRSGRPRAVASLVAVRPTAAI